MILGLLSDAHGNREAFDRGLSVLRAAGAETVYFLGDAVGYLPGTDVIDAIEENSVVAIRGNHDVKVLAGDVDEPRDAIFRHRETAHAMTAEQRAIVEAWPTRREIDSAAGASLLVHGSPTDPIGGYVYPDTDLTPFAGFGWRAVFMGQTHRPFVRRLGDTVFVNVGSCGLPRDCGGLGAACLYDDVSGDVTVVRYDITSATVEALRRCGPVAPEVAEVFRRESPAGCYGETYD
jgi:predicted phosphodiesterase